MMTYLGIIQARLSSTRLPAKVMLDLAGKTQLERVHESVSHSSKIDKIIVATSSEVLDNIISLKLEELGIPCFRGDLNNVLARFYLAAKHFKTKNIVRITADNPLTDGTLIDTLIDAYETSDADYAVVKNAPYGLSAEVFSFKLLEQAYHNASTEYEKEHVTPYIRQHGKLLELPAPVTYNYPDTSVTVDTLEDYVKMQDFYLFCEKNGYVASIKTFMQYIMK